jgi:hypothetical protein
LLLADAKKAIMDGITQPSKRGQQALIGPSEIGGCPYCVGEKLAVKFPKIYNIGQPKERFGLGSWIGTAVHKYLDVVIDIPTAQKEKKNVIAKIKGYGTIKGSTDLYIPPHIFDYKIVGKWSYDNMRLDYLEHPNQIPTTKYRVQQMLYGLGWKKLGYNVETVNLVVIPKMSNDPEDIKFFTENYNEELALAALDRLEKILDNVRRGQLDELPSDEDCYVCSRITFRI